MSRALSLLLTASILAWGPTQVAVAKANTSQTEPADGLSAHTRVDASGVDASAGAIAERIRKRLGAQPVQGLALVDDETAAATLTVTVTWVNADLAHYKVDMVATNGTGERQTFSRECETCTDQELADRVADAIPEVAAFLGVTTEDEDSLAIDGAASEHEADSAAATPAEPLASSPADARSDRKMNGMMIGGVVAGAAGLAIGGVAIIAKPMYDSAVEARFRGPTRQERKAAERRMTAAQITGIGGAVVAGALIATAVALYLTGKKQQERDMAVVPAISPRRAGLVLQGRF